MASIFSLIPTPWRVALGCGLMLSLFVVGTIAAWQGYSAGYDKAKALGEASLAALRSQHDKDFAAHMAQLNKQLQKETQAAMDISNKLAAERKTNASEQERLRAQIAQVTRNSTHIFSAEFVRVWNQAVTIASGDTMPQADNTPGATGKAGTGEAVKPGLLAAGNVSEADVLAYITYYGKRAKDMEKQLNAWIDLAERNGWNEPL